MDAKRIAPLLAAFLATTGCFWWDVPATAVEVDSVLAPADPDPLTSEGRPNKPDYYGSVYYVGIDDVIKIEVSDHTEFTGEVVVDKHGKVEMPLLSNSDGTRLHVEGLALDQITELVRETISPYVLNTPPVSVTLVQSNSKHYFMLGYVGREGRFRMGESEVRLREALLRAGMFRKGANHARVHIITPDETNPTYVAVNGWDILAGRTKDNLTLKPNDIVFVPPTAWQITAEAISEIVSRTQAIRSADLTYNYWDTEQFLDSSEVTTADPNNK